MQMEIHNARSPVSETYSGEAEIVIKMFTG
jgi:hypothetical protein